MKEIETKTYTQEEVNEIVEQVKARQQEKFSKKIENSYVELDKYNELQAKLSDLELSNKSNSFKDTFISNGGNSNAYNDFISINKDILNLSQEEQIKKLNEIREQKPYFFDNKQEEPISNHKPINNGNGVEIVKEMLNQSNKQERIPGTIYKKRY